MGVNVTVLSAFTITVPISVAGFSLIVTAIGKSESPVSFARTSTFMAVLKLVPRLSSLATGTMLVSSVTETVTVAMSKSPSTSETMYVNSSIPIKLFDGM